MPQARTILLILLLSISIMSPVQATATDTLLAQLSQFKGTSPVSLDVNYSRTTQGKFDGEQRTINGEVNYQVETDLKRIKVSFSNGTLDRMQQERQLKLEDPKAQTPVTEAMDRLEPTRSMKLTDASIDIKQWIHEGNFVDSKKTESGTSLRYEMPLESMLDGNIKKYVKKFESELTIYVSNEGIPTSAKMTMSGKGSAFIFFTMKASSESFYEFDVVGDRLIQTKVEQHWKHDSTFSKGDTRISIVAAAQ